jgi:hypothetical protein
LSLGDVTTTSLLSSCARAAGRTPYRRLVVTALDELRPLTVVAVSGKPVAASGQVAMAHSGGSERFLWYRVPTARG